MPLSKSQLDRLGDRLRQGSAGEDDLRLLDEHRRSFLPAYDNVVETIRGRLGLNTTGRPGKSTGSIREKLQRESIRLAQVQDIAGCRIVVPALSDQERAIASITTAFTTTTLVDRRINPSYGYRAVHIIVTLFGKMVEVQVRTDFQHLWAELSEKLSDLLGSALKYGRGLESASHPLAAAEAGELLDRTSQAIEMYESLEQQLMPLKAIPETFPAGPQRDVATKLVAEVEGKVEEARTHISELLRDAHFGVGDE